MSHAEDLCWVLPPVNNFSAAMKLIFRHTIEPWSLNHPTIPTIVCQNMCLFVAFLRGPV